METFLSIAFLVFALAFFTWSMQHANTSLNQDRDHRDRRDDLAYHRMLQERREFGYDKVEEAITSRPFFRKYRFK